MAEIKNERSGSYESLRAVSLVFTLIGLVALVTGIVMSSNPPNPYSSDVADLLKHSGGVGIAFSIAGSCIGIAIVGWLIVMAVDALLEELPARMQLVMRKAAPKAPEVRADPEAPASTTA